MKTCAAHALVRCLEGANPFSRQSSSGSHRLGALIALLGLAVASAAPAADFALSGTFHDKRGTIELPLASTLFAVPRGMTAMGTVMQTGTALVGGGPATITLPPNVVSDVPTGVGGFLIPAPSIIQFLSTIGHYGPSVTTTLMAGRSGPGNFAYCPGAAANPSCTTVAAGGSQGTVDGIVRYTAGPNKFGGTLKMLFRGTNVLTLKGAALPATVMTMSGATLPALPFSAVNNGEGTGGLPRLVPAGLSYAAMAIASAGAAARTHPYGYMNTPKGLLSPGPFLGLGMPQQSEQTGFPLTTGMVYMYRKISAQASAPAAPSKVSVTGYDKRTAAGAGRILLVAGAISRLSPQDGSNPPEGSGLNGPAIYSLNFTPQPALPLASPAALGALGSLIVLAAGFATSRSRR